MQGIRRWINTEEKAKVVAAIWGTEFIQVKKFNSSMMQHVNH